MASDLLNFVSSRIVSFYSKKFFRLFRITNRSRRVFTVLMVSVLLSNPAAAATVETTPVATSFAQDMRYAFYSSGWGKYFGFNLTSTVSQSLKGWDGKGAPKLKRPAPAKAEKREEREARVARVKISPGDVKIHTGETVVLIATGQDSEGNSVGGLDVKWSVTREDQSHKVSISPEGEFKSNNPGRFIVTAEISGVREQVKVDVSGKGVRPKATAVESEIKVDSKELRKNRELSKLAPASENSKRLIARNNGKNTRASSSGMIRAPRMFNRPELEIGEDAGGLNSATIETINNVGNERGDMPGRADSAGAGSGNFQLNLPAVSLDGRGIDVNLSFNYNSRIWHKDDTTMYFDIDRDWYAGWNTGFGKIVMAGDQYMMINSDGTRHEFSGTTTKHPWGYQTFNGRTTDGTFIDYLVYGKQKNQNSDNGKNIDSGSALLPNGTKIIYGAGGNYAIYPTKITDAHGNYITITYKNPATGETNTGPYIDQIQDTLGRVVTFHYAPGSNLLTAITVPGLKTETNPNPADRQVIRFAYRYLNLEDAGPNKGFQSTLTTSVRQNTIIVPLGIYYPGTSTGYWFGDYDSYSRYGMIRKVSHRVGMTFSGGLNEQGTFGPGTQSYVKYYENPSKAGYSDIIDSIADTPLYTQMREDWLFRQSEIPTTYFDHTDVGFVRKTIVTRADGIRSIQFSDTNTGSSHYGLMTESATYRKLTGNPALDDTPFSRIVTYFENGDYGSSRPGLIESYDELGRKTYVTMNYGLNFNAPTDVREYGWSNQLLKHLHTEYLNNDERYIGASTSYGGRSGRHIFNLPTMVEVFSGVDGARVSRTEYVYDEESKTLINAPDVPYHDLSFNPYAPLYQVCTDKPDPSDPDCTYSCPSYDPPPECSGSDGTCTWIPDTCSMKSPFEESTKYRGNVTKTITYANAATLDANSAIIANFTYDITGNVRIQSTACCEQATFNYTYATRYAWPESMTRGSVSDAALQNTTSAVYDLNTGLVVDSYDTNGRRSNILYDANSLRPIAEYLPTKESLRTGAYVYHIYSDVGLNTNDMVYEAGKSGGGYSSRVDIQFDGKGQAYYQATYGTDNARDAVHIMHDTVGRVWKQFLPFREGIAEDQKKWTETTYDFMDRPIKIKSPDDSIVERFYNDSSYPNVAASNIGQTVRSKDSWGRERWGRFDEQNRLVEVVEPNPSGDGTVITGGIPTQFQYDTLGNLKQINQGDQVRKFNYDSLGRLTHQKLAERDATLDDAGNWTTSGIWSDVFSYDNRSNLVFKKDARGVITQFEYNDDPLNRLKVVRYRRDQVPYHLVNNILDAPNVSYTYATSGDKMRVTNVSVDGGFGSQVISYDYESRVSEVSQTSRGGIQLYTNYLWDTLDRVKEVCYPQQIGVPGDPRKIVAHSYDKGSRLTELKYDNKTMASSPVFNAANQVTSLTIGELLPSGDKIKENYDFDPKTGLLISQQVSKGSEKLLDLKYNYTKSNDANNIGAKTGQLTSVIDLKNQMRNRSYIYDPLGRLYQVKGGANAATNSPEWNQIYSYDRYGNKTGQTKTGGDPVQSNPVDTVWFDDALPAGAVPNVDNTGVSASFKTSAGFYLSAVKGGGWEVNVNKTTSGTNEKFKLIDVNGGTLESGDSIQLVAANGTHYVSVREGESPGWTPPDDRVYANKTQAGSWETLVIRKSDGTTGTIGTGTPVTIQSVTGKYFRALNGGGNLSVESPTSHLYAVSTSVGIDESFNFEVVANDANGVPSKVGFKSRIGRYFTARQRGYWEVDVTWPYLEEEQTFTLTDLNSGQLESGDKIKLISYGGETWLTAIDGGGPKWSIPSGQIYARQPAGIADSLFIFTIRKTDGTSGVISTNTSISLQTENGYYLYAEGGGAAAGPAPPIGQLYATSSLVNSESMYTMDVVGGGGHDESWNWITSNPPPQSGTKAHQSSIASGYRQHVFTGATETLSVGSGDNLYTWVYLDPANMPEEIVLHWTDGSSWEHRAYWGANIAPIAGTDGTTAHKRIGDLPPAGQWVKLVIPASAVGLEGISVSGMAFSVYGGRATWDKTGKITPGAVASLGIPLDGLANQNVNPFSYNSTNNRITSPGYEYDHAGNLMAGSVDAQQNRRTFKYDSANRLRQVFDINGTLISDYLYGSSNERIAFTEGGVTTWYAREGGQVIAEYEAVGASGLQWKMSYIYMGGRLLATEQSHGIRYHHPDRLGSRLVTDALDGSVISENLHLPFGTAMPLGATLGGDNSWQDPAKSNLSKKKFTSYDRSEGTGLDYAVNRQYSSTQGRFTQVDPIGMGAVNPLNPQSLNLYAYCMNDPVNMVDPTGLVGEDHPDYPWWLLLIEAEGRPTDEAAIGMAEYEKRLGETRQAIADARAAQAAYDDGDSITALQIAANNPNVAIEITYNQSKEKKQTLAGTLPKTADGKATTTVTSTGAGALLKIFGVAYNVVDLLLTLTITTGENDTLPTLYHYSNKEGYDGIMATRVIKPSLQGAHGSGQYFTDLSPWHNTIGEVARVLFGYPQATSRLTHYVQIRISGLTFTNPAPNIYLVPGISNLSIAGRLASDGATKFKP